MAAYWYVDGVGARQGPVEEEDLLRLLQSNAVSSETLVWTAGQTDWTRASSIERFRSALLPAPPPVSATPLPGSGHAMPHGVLTSTVETWGLFWRGLLLVLASPFVIPAPWVNVSFWRYITQRTIAPDGRPLRFEGRPGDIWYVFVGQALLLWPGQLFPKLSVVTILLSVALSFMTMRWVCHSVWVTAPQRRFEFVGSFWSYVGWCVLMGLSIFTIIGWAWAFAAYARWLCRNVRGDLQFEFVGSGLALLWRTSVAILVSSFVIPIPWMAKWFFKWYVAQIQTRPA